MKSKLTDVRRLMDDSVFEGEKFTEQHKRQVLNRITKEERKVDWVPRSLSVVFSLVLIIAVAYLLNTVLDKTPVQQGNPDGAEQPQTPPQEPIESLVPPVPEDSEANKEKEDAAKEEENTPNEEENETADDGVFELTPEEMAAYENFSADFDTAHLKDLDPVSVAKLYVWAGYNQNYEVEYELLTDREESIMWSKEEHLAIPAEDKSSPDEVFKVFNNIEDGEFIQREEHRGYIRYYPTEARDPEATRGFQMRQNEDGVWQVGFMALQ
ncbi:hypothetical protein [Planomicrobium okeanokoites]|uniref:Uncharacterized protein n=1 Tax=Planomicrobium okeanokoites TaxID=244 RepID=A0ABV7KS99_PLAOK|nr:hypothetical protein [Planomicrobium okeanokoites]TAA70165.1 hypothetical protein D2910_06855 [Planomicrobium okeanokoites]